MHKDPYLVVGTGRSGTSFVAGVLHNDMVVHMGNEFPPANPTNPDGFWEDIDFYNLHIKFAEGEITYPDFLDKTLTLIRERQAMGIPWGFKESRMSVLLGTYLALFNNPKIIWCRREPKLVLASLKRCYGFDDKHAHEFYYTREIMLERLLRNRDPLIIYFDKSTKTKDEVISAIVDKWQT